MYMYMHVQVGALYMYMLAYKSTVECIIHVQSVDNMDFPIGRFRILES